MFESWFRKWWKKNLLHIIKIKLLLIKRYAVLNVSNVKLWFKLYKNVLHKLKIWKRNIINFNKTEFRTNYTRKKQIIIFEKIKQIYTISFENHKLVTIVKMINTVENYSSLLMIIIQKRKIITNRFSNNFSSETLIVFSDNDFTFDKIVVKFLKHYIKHSDAELNTK